MSERYHIYYKIKGSCYFHTVSSSLYGASKNLFINFTTWLLNDHLRVDDVLLIFQSNRSDTV